jgi:pimeloyl-ACP methyl ester carboxylesterase
VLSKAARAIVAVGLLVVVASLLACGDDGGGDETPAPTPLPGAFTWLTSDGLTLEGRAFGPETRGGLAVLLAHQYQGSQQDWLAFAEELAVDGYRVYTFNFRGVGMSEGEHDPAGFDEDVAAILRYIADDGPGRVLLIGASAGGTASLIAGSLPEGIGVAGVATLSAPVAFQGLDATTSLARIEAQVLALASEDDGSAPASAEDIASMAASGAVQVYPGDAHGTQMLEGPAGAEVEAQLRLFIASAE